MRRIFLSALVISVALLSVAPQVMAAKHSKPETTKSSETTKKKHHGFSFKKLGHHKSGENTPTETTTTTKPKS